MYGSASPASSVDASGFAAGLLRAGNATPIPRGILVGDLLDGDVEMTGNAD